MDSFKSVRALLATSCPDDLVISPRLLAGSSALLNALNTNAIVTSPPKAGKTLKAKKRAAFEAWHRRKLEQLNGDADGVDDDNEVSSTTLGLLSHDARWTGHNHAYSEVLPCAQQKRSKVETASVAGGSADGTWSPSSGLSDQLILSLMQRDNGDSPVQSPTPLCASASACVRMRND
jgi:hypothetical protein